MNRTGGILDRSRNGKSSLAAKQKAYFAKARGRPNTTHTSPPTFEIFGTVSRRPLVNDTPNRRLGGDVHKNSQKLGLARYHDSNRNLQSERQSSLPRAESSPYPRDTNRRSPVIISSRQSSISAFKEDGYDSPPTYVGQGLQQPDQGRKASMPISSETQRDRLLNILDWVGISHTKPAKIDFTDFHDRDKVGKRRRLSDMHHQSHRPKRRWKGLPSQNHRQDSLAPNVLLSQANVSVRIGSMVDRQSEREAREKCSSSKLDHASTMSDEMLLDERLSDKNVNSHELAKENHPITQANCTQQSRSHELSPSACTFDSEDVRIEAKNGQTFEYDHETLEAPEDPNDFGRGLPRLLPSNGPKFMGGLSDEEKAPGSFQSQDALPPGDGNPRPKTGSPREQNPNREWFKAGSERLVSRETRQNLLQVSALTVQNSLVKPDFLDVQSSSRKTRTSMGQLRDSIPSQEYLVDQKDHVTSRFKASDEGDLRPSSQTHLDSMTPTARPVSAYEEKTGKRFVNKELPDQPSRTEALEPVSTLLVKANTPLPHVGAPEEASIEKAKNLKATTDEDEALWRKFVFGGEHSSLDWTVELEERDAGVASREAALTDPTAQTQPSMEAEISTSPLKQNPHLIEEALKYSHGARMDESSRISTMPSTSQPNSDEMLDGEDHESGSGPLAEIQHTRAKKVVDYHSPSSNVAQASTSPSTTSVDVHTIPSSLIVEAPPPPPPPPPPNLPPPPHLSSDELSWSPTRLSQSTATAARQIVIFKKPSRYIGERSLGPLQPVFLGRKGKMGRRPSKERGKQGRGRRLVKKGYAEEDEILGHIEPEQGRILEDDIEDF